MKYFVLNLDNGEHWEGEADNAKEAYKHITVKKGHTTTIKYGRLFSTKVWTKDKKS
jgi:hypothetical protein